MYTFRDVEDIETFLLEALGVELLIPSVKSEEIVFFHNGDKMTVNTATRELLWEPINPGELSTSRHSMRFHQWFGKGIIQKT